MLHLVNMLNEKLIIAIVLTGTKFIVVNMIYEVKS